VDSLIFADSMGCKGWNG